ncbi:hypothetical protein [Kordia sp. SMS9]|uniref:hypothetical protein n=1 Tax=Kordia sp. SMS9 TaxID=2282170 RepID=UPI0013B361F9|nr:hypothetical protein [Kordia sp. SMS9]
MTFMFFGATEDATDPKTKKFFAIMLVSIGLGIFLGIMALSYHFISFRYYRKTNRMRRMKKVPAYFLVCAILSHIYFLLISTTFLAGGIFGFMDIKNSEAFVFYLITLFIFAYAIGSLIETGILKKRIRQYEKDVFLRDEIDTIGVSES